MENVGKPLARESKGGQPAAGPICPDANKRQWGGSLRGIYACIIPNGIIALCKGVSMGTELALRKK